MFFPTPGRHERESETDCRLGRLAGDQSGLSRRRPTILSRRGPWRLNELTALLLQCDGRDPIARGKHGRPPHHQSRRAAAVCLLPSLARAINQYQKNRRDLLRFRCTEDAPLFAHRRSPGATLRIDEVCICCSPLPAREPPALRPPAGLVGGSMRPLAMASHAHAPSSAESERGGILRAALESAGRKTNPGAAIAPSPRVPVRPSVRPSGRSLVRSFNSLLSSYLSFHFYSIAPTHLDGLIERASE